MTSGYSILAEGYIREKRFEEALQAAEHLPESHSKELVVREIRGNAVKTGNLELYKKTSQMIGIKAYPREDIAMIFLVAVGTYSTDAMLAVIDHLPNGNTKTSLLTTAIAELASAGLIQVCERLAEKRGMPLTRDELGIIKISTIREGWIYDAERAAELAETMLTPDDYAAIFIANKNKGLLYETQIAAERAGIQLNTELLTSLLLAAIKHNRPSAWEVAEMIEQSRES